MSVLEQARQRRSGRMAMWVGVGATGAVIDILITVSLLGQVHYLLANAAGFSVAVTSNFSLNYLLTYGRPSGRMVHQYAGYVFLSLGTFALRAGTIFAGVELVGGGTLAASVVGIGVAGSLNFLGVERILGQPSTVWHAAVETLHDAAEFIFSTRLRSVLMSTGGYGIAFSVYARLLSVLYRDDTKQITLGPVTAELMTEQPTETVSVLHSLEAERDILGIWAAHIKPSDRVLDIGANVGVFSVIAAEPGASVTAVEPHGPTADRLRQNLEKTDSKTAVKEIALGRRRRTAALSVDNDQAGTQRPELTSGSEVPVWPGDQLSWDPTVVKIDIEGHELSALKGLHETLQSVRLVLVEAHSDSDRDEITALLERHGFRVDQLTTGAEMHLRGVRSD
jgi:FkbM family methyltransferase